MKLVSSRGKTMTTLLPKLAADDGGLVTIYCDNGTGYIQFWRSVFDRRAPESIQAVEKLAGTEIRQGNNAREQSDELLAALTQAYREAVTNITAQPRL